jgi:hypothetical protein
MVNLINSQRPVPPGSPDIGNFVATKEFLLLGDGPPDAGTTATSKTSAVGFKTSTILYSTV